MKRFFVVVGEHAHQPVLQLVNVLEFVDHDVFQTLLPLEADRIIDVENVQHVFDQVVVVEAEAFLLLIQIAPENDIVGHRRVVVLRPQLVERQGDHIFVVFGVLEELADLDHVARFTERHVTERQAALLVDDLQHRVDVGVVEHKEVLRVPDGGDVLLQHGHTEAVKRRDVARVAVAGERADAFFHLAGRLVRERGAQDVLGQDADLGDEVGEAVRERARLAAAGAGDDAEAALRCGDGLALRVVESLE